MPEPIPRCSLWRTDEGADDWFVNLDKLIKNANADGRINVFYSSPADYTAAKLAEAASGEVRAGVRDACVCVSGVGCF